MTQGSGLHSVFLMKRRFTEDSWRREPWFQSLVSAFLQCKDKESMAAFLRDIGTLSELQAWSERLEIARLLGKGLSYRQVSAMTGASTTTVTRVAQFLENGQGGYREYLHVHRHHDVRKSRPHETNLNEQNNDTDIEVQPKQTMKDSDRKLSVSPLQKYLQKP